MRWISIFPSIQVTDVIEVLILTFLIYQIIVWIKKYQSLDAAAGNPRSCGVHLTCGYF